MGLFSKWRYRLLDRKIPGIIVIDEQTIEISDGLIRESNHLKDPWQDKGYEIQTRPIAIIRAGKSEPGYICSSYGVTATLKEDITQHPVGIDNAVVSIRWSGVIGKMTSADIIEKGFDLVGSLKRVFVGVLIGMALYAIIVGPILGKILS